LHHGGSNGRDSGQGNSIVHELLVLATDVLSSLFRKN
jgi:hypothetical protein